jgi:two-component system, OmpR family, response regulator QseB
MKPVDAPSKTSERCVYLANRHQEIRLRTLHSFAWHPRYVPTPQPGPALLLVEDDRALSAMLAELFAEQGYRVDTAFDSQQGLHRGLRGSYDAMIVDRGLPVMDGSELIALLRSRGVTTPALVLTARGSVADRVEGLDAGAQDYLVKPFEIPELLARVRALLRRTDNAATTVRAGGLRLDRVKRHVSGATPTGAHVELSEREASLLVVLMTAPRQVFSRAQLLDLVFDDAETAGAVDSYVHYLRRKLGKQVVRTVHGTGYRFGLK